MARVVFLDSGPLGLACRPRTNEEAVGFAIWRMQMQAAGAMIVIPEVADYEVRRGLILDAKASGSAGHGVKRLDALRQDFIYLPLNTAAMRRAADLWAESRLRGRPTSAEVALDGDAIVAAQALEYCGLGDRLTVATDNIGHLSRFVEALPWHEIEVP